MALSSSGLGRGLLKAKTRVRFPLGLLNFSAGSSRKLGFESRWEHMKTPVILKNRYLALTFLAAAIILAAGFFIFGTNLWDNQNLLVIHFDSFRGANFFGDRRDVLDILITASIIWLINLVLANEFYLRERILSYLMAGSTLFFSVLILIAVNVIININ